MEDRVEPPSWLPEGAAPAVAEEEDAPVEPAAAVDDTSADLEPVAFDATGPHVEEAGLGEHGAAGHASADSAGDGAEVGAAFGNGAAAAPAESAGGASAEPAFSAAGSGSVFERHDASGSVFERDDASGYGYGSSGWQGYAGGHYPGNAGEYGYNDDMGPAAGETSSTPPYSAGYPGQPAAPLAHAPLAPPAEHAAAAQVRRQGQQARRASLVIARLEPWSVMKFSFLMSLVAWIVLFVAVALLYYALSSLGVFTAIGETLARVTSSQGSNGVNIARWTSASRVLGYTMLIGAVNIVIITLLSTIGAMIYNLVARLGGGVEVTLRETD